MNFAPGAKFFLPSHEKYIMKCLWDNLKRALQKRDEQAPDQEPEAVVACRRAAEQGEAGAQACLGDMYYNGEDVPQDYAVAAEWYRRAAEQGQAAAQFQLGNMQRVGLGVLQSQAEADRWLKRAAEQGDAAAQALLEKLSTSDSAGSQEFNEAVRHLRAAAEQGQAGAQLLLGAMHETGNGVTRDPVAALAWVERALARLAPGPLRDAGLRQQLRLAGLLTAEDQARARSPRGVAITSPGK